MTKKASASAQIMAPIRSAIIMDATTLSELIALCLKTQRDDADKLQRITRYTCATCTRLGFTPSEVSYISLCVRHLVTRDGLPRPASIPLTKRAGVTQIALKNFVWNIGNQYGIYGMPLAQFLHTTFSPWFTNTTLATTVKTLKTTRGRHTVPIDEHIDKYIDHHIDKYTGEPIEG